MEEFTKYHYYAHQGNSIYGTLKKWKSIKKGEPKQ